MKTVWQQNPLSLSLNLQDRQDRKFDLGSPYDQLQTNFDSIYSSETADRDPKDKKKVSIVVHKYDMKNDHLKNWQEHLIDQKSFKNPQNTGENFE